MSPEPALRGAPRIAICVGAHGSASTWCYNAVRRLLEAEPKARIAALFADDPGPGDEAAIAAATRAVIKCHTPSIALRMLARETGAATVVSIRDPRDCVVSMMMRFGWPFARALDKVTRSSRAALDWMRLVENATLLRYEDGFADDPATLDHLAAALGVTVPVGVRAAIFAALRPERIRADMGARFGADVSAQAAERLYDPRSHWHARHVGDGRTGKFAEMLTPAQLAEVEAACWPALCAFGYLPWATPPLEPGEQIGFAAAERGARLLIDGFRSPESWGVWTNAPVARLALPLRCAARRATLGVLHLHGADLRGDGAWAAEIRVAGASHPLPKPRTEDARPPRPLHVRADFALPEATTTLLTEIHVGNGADDSPAFDRPGLGLISLRCDYA